MHELLGRNVKVGDFVLASPERGSFDLELKFYGIVISSRECFFQQGVRKVVRCYLITNLCEEEIQIKNELNRLYQERLYNSQLKKEAQKAREKELRGLRLRRYLPGDIFQYQGSNYNIGLMYIGLVNVKFLSSNDPYYVKHFPYDTQDKYKHCYISLLDKKFKYLQNVNELNKESLQEILVDSELDLLKSLSMKFTEVYHHVELLKDCYTEPILVWKSQSVYKESDKHKYDFEVLLKKEGIQC